MWFAPLRDRNAGGAFRSSGAGGAMQELAGSRHNTRMENCVALTRSDRGAARTTLPQLVVQQRFTLLQLSAVRSRQGVGIRVASVTPPSDHEAAQLLHSICPSASRSWIDCNIFLNIVLLGINNEGETNGRTKALGAWDRIIHHKHFVGNQYLPTYCSRWRYRSIHARRDG